MATFPNLFVDRAGNYTLVATAVGLSAISNSFLITSGPPTAGTSLLAIGHDSVLYNGEQAYYNTLVRMDVSAGGSDVRVGALHVGSVPLTPVRGTAENSLPSAAGHKPSSNSIR